MKKTIFENATMELIRFDLEDVIVTSIVVDNDDVNTNADTLVQFPG